jgi:hypothetical protein
MHAATAATDAGSLAVQFNPCGVDADAQHAIEQASDEMTTTANPLAAASLAKSV